MEIINYSLTFIGWIGLLIAAIPLLASQNAKKGSKTKQSTGFKLNLHREKYNQEESGHTDDGKETFLPTTVISL